MKISELFVHPSNGLEIVRYLFNSALEWDVEFNLSIITQLMRLDGDAYTDKHGRVHKLPENATIIAETLKHFLAFTGDNNVLAWQQFMLKTEQHPGFAKWMCLAFLCREKLACNSSQLLKFLESLDGPETAAFSTLLHLPDYLAEEPYSNIVSKAEQSLIKKIGEFAVTSVKENDQLLEASAHYSFMLHDTDIIIPTVVKSVTFGLGLRILDARHLSHMLEIISRSLNNNADRFSASIDAVNAAIQYVADKSIPGQYHVKKANFSDLERAFMTIYDGVDKDHQLKYFIEEYSVINTSLTTAECHILSMINSFIDAVQPSLLRECSPINTFHLYDYKKDLTQEDIDNYINHWKDEIVESSAFRRVFPAHGNSFYAHHLFDALKLRSDSNFAFYSRTDESTYSKLLNYAVLRCALLSHNHLLKQNLNHLSDHEQFSEHYLDESVESFISTSGLRLKEEIDGGMMKSAFKLLPSSEQTIDNKLFCRMPLSQDELMAANPRQKRHRISHELGL